MVGDCLDLMSEMDDKCVDYVFTSPPYNDNGTSYTPHKATHKKYEHIEKYDDYFEWLVERVDEMLRITKKLVIFNIQGIKNNREALYKFIGHYSDRIHDILIWTKPTATPCSTPHKISNYYEMIILIKPDGVDSVDVNSMFYKNVIHLNANKNNTYASIHRAVMSKDLCMEIIDEFTQENTIVLDPFMGTGTTAVCCKHLNRHYIGFEISDKYAEICKQRIIEETAKDGLW